MKKTLLAVALAGLTVAGTFGGITASADVSLEECDLCFQSAVNGILEDKDVIGNSVKADRRPVYDLNLQHLGFVYEFEVASGYGYSIIVCEEGEYSAREFMPSAASPYTQVAEGELCVYVNTMSYFKSVDGKINDLYTSEEIPEETVEALSESAIYYKQGIVATPEYISIRVDYTSKSEDGKEICLRVPQFWSIGLAGGCAAVAGANILGYFDRYNEELIPNHDAGKEYYGHYIYNFQDRAVEAAMTELYNDMGGSSNGITEPAFISGMEKYCAKKNNKIKFVSVKSGNGVNYDTVKYCINSGFPIALFLSTYNVGELSVGNNYDQWDYEYYSGNHVMVGFGYRTFTYGLSNGQTRVERLISVATGWSLPKTGYFNIDSMTNINSAHYVSIY